MLLLDRKLHEEITIPHPDGDIIVRVCAFSHGRVKLGFTSPDSVKILRSELVDPGPETRS